MMLCIDVGNTNIYAGVYDGDHMVDTFRRELRAGSSADELGMFFRSVLRENGIDPVAVTEVGIASVVPSIVHSLRGAMQKYFHTEPFLLQAKVRTGLNIKVRNPLEVGADRIANAIAAVAQYPKQDLIIIDFGTATTLCVVNARAEYLGGAILPGIRLSMEALAEKTARLNRVEILEPDAALGRSTVDSIQSGLYFGHLGAVRELIAQFTDECFASRKPFIIGTGGFSRLFESRKVFDVILPNLVLDGVRIALTMNRE